MPAGANELPTQNGSHSTESVLVQAEQFQAWYTSSQMKSLQAVWLLYSTNGDGPEEGEPISINGAGRASRYSSLSTLIEAVEDNDDEAVMLCARRGHVDLDSVSPEISATALGLAASCDYYEVTAQLLGLGASVSATYGTKGMTAFLSAIVENNIDMVRLFLSGKRSLHDQEDDPLAVVATEWQGELLLLTCARSALFHKTKHCTYCRRTRVT